MNEPSQVLDETSQELLDAIVDEFTDRLNLGQQPDIEDYVQKHPQIADLLKQILTPLQALHGQAAPQHAHLLARQASSGTLDNTDLGATAPSESLGVYRIVREVGRGGMGVVYEAEHTQLLRRVALKVLPAALSDEILVRRFEREARAAANLHHTHIVPVYETGVAAGKHFIAMQFIAGTGLDEVVARRARQQRVAGSMDSTPARTATAGDQKPARGNATMTKDGAVTLSGAATAVESILAGAGGADAAEQAGIGTIGAMAPSKYCAIVGKWGVQAAQALDYAHSRGVLHRDIKPSNLLLDGNLDLWVSDFGLAKTEDDNLTNTGDIVGTLRYMAPERFRGQANSRSDVYSLGLSLYELLALRPAFDNTDRVHLIQQIAEKHPPALRSVNAAIPRDLETIVLKAMAKDPADRYASAGELAEDLQAFLHDQPIRARRWSHVESAVRWCRRRPVVASLLMLSFLLLVTTLVASIWLAQALGTAQKNLGRAEIAEGDVRKTLHVANKQLYDSLVSGASLKRRSKQVGQRFDTLENIRRAVALAGELKLLDSERLRLRNEAIAALTVVDLRDDRSWPAPATQKYAFDAELKRYAGIDRNGVITVRSFEDNRELVRLSGSPSSTSPYYQYLCFAPNGRFLAWMGTPRTAIHPLRAAGVTGFPASPMGQACLLTASQLHGRRMFINRRQVHLWDLGTGKLIRRYHSAIMREDRMVCFSPDSCLLAFADSNQSIVIYDVQTGKKCRAVQFPSVVYSSPSFVFGPESRRLAVAHSINLSAKTPRISIFDIASGTEQGHIALPSSWHSFAWNGRLLAAGCSDKNVYVWDTDQPWQPLAVYGNHVGSVSHVTFNHAGDVLMSSNKYGTHLWNPFTGDLLLKTEITAERFNRRNQLAGASAGPDKSMARWNVSAGPACRMLYAHHPYQKVISVAFSRHGRLFASAAREGGYHLWEIRSGRALARLPAGQDVRVAFDDASRNLYTGFPPQRWPVKETTPGVLQIGPGERLIRGKKFPGPPPLAWPWLAWGGLRLSQGPLLLFPDTPIVRLLQTPQTPDVRVSGYQFKLTGFPNCMTMSPDGQWVAHGWEKLPGVVLRHARYGRGIRGFPPGKSQSLAQFSPDGRWLVESSLGELVFWKAGTWQESHRIALKDPVIGRVAFTRDGRLMAVAERNRIRLLVPETGAEVAVLAAPGDEPMAAQVAMDGVLAFSPDGALLVASTLQGPLQLWNLQHIRTRLRHLGLDWEVQPPPLAPAPAADIVHVKLDLKDAGPLSTIKSLTKRIEEKRKLVHPHPEKSKAKDDLAALLRSRSAHFSRSGDFRSAIEDYRQGFMLRPKDSYFAIGLASLYMVHAPNDLSDAEAVLPFVERQVPRFPKHPRYMVMLGVLYYRLGRLDEAEATLKRASETRLRYQTLSEPPAELLGLALVYHAKGEKKWAQNHYRNFIQWRKAYPNHRSQTGRGSEGRWVHLLAEAEKVLFRSKTVPR